MRDQGHAEDLPRDGGGFRGVLRHFHAAAFAAAARVNLRFHHDAAAEFLRSRFGFGDGIRHLPAGHGDIVFGQN